jgi:molybdenum cofactor cytidylyltransferase
MPNLAVAILAAGASSRMGQPKQLLLFRGKALVQHAVEIAVATGCTAIYLVVNPEEQSAIRQAFKQSQDRSNDKSNDEEEHHRFPVDVSADDVALLVNESFTDGISTSIRLATTIVSAKPEIDGIMFLNCDQPFLTAADLLRLIGCYAEGKIIASSFAGTIGSPAIFHRDFFNDLLQLAGDVGAQSIIKQQREHVVVCEMTEAQFDVDTPDDYKALLAKSEKAAT